MTKFKNIWTSKNISTKTRQDTMVTCVISIVLYACETWTLKKKDKNKLMAFVMRTCRRILNVRWQQEIANEEIRKRMGSKRNTIQRIKERILNLFWHIFRMEVSRLIKEVVFQEMKGKQKEDNQKGNGWKM